MFNIIKRYYERGLYTKANVATFVRSGQIDKDDYYLITGEDFV